MTETKRKMTDNQAQTRTLNGARIILVLAELNLGGAERQALLLAEYLANEQNAQVEIWGLDGTPGRVAKVCEEKGIPWQLVPVPWFAGRSKQVRGLIKLISALRRARPDIILSYLIVPNVICGLAWRWTGARSFIWNQREHGLGRLGPRSERWAVRQTPWFISNSEHGAEFLMQSLGTPPERVRVVHNGIQLAPPQSDRAAWRSRLGIEEGTFVACKVANLTTYKDHATLLRAWRLVLDRMEAAGRSAVLLLAGSMESSDNTQLATKSLAYDLDLGRSVRFLGAVEDVSGLFYASDLSVFSSRSEGSPNGVLESMAAGLALAGTDNPGVRAAVGPDGHQFLAPPGDAEALSNRILRLATDTALRERVGRANRLRIEKEFSLRQMCEGTLAVIKSGLGSKAAPRGDNALRQEEMAHLPLK